MEARIIDRIKGFLETEAFADAGKRAVAKDTCLQPGSIKRIGDFGQKHEIEAGETGSRA